MRQESYLEKLESINHLSYYQYCNDLAVQECLQEFLEEKSKKENEPIHFSKL